MQCYKHIRNEKQVYESLREVINSIMIEAGYQDLIKHFWRKI